jgi:hypothetical protein
VTAARQSRRWIDSGRAILGRLYYSGRAFNDSTPCRSASNMSRRRSTWKPISRQQEACPSPRQLISALLPKAKSRLPMTRHWHWRALALSNHIRPPLAPVLTDRSAAQRRDRPFNPGKLFCGVSLIISMRRNFSHHGNAGGGG